MYTKSAAWGYERKHRIVSGHGRNAALEYEDFPLGAREPESVFFGLNAER